MKTTDIKLDEDNYEMLFSIPEQAMEQVYLILSDDLEVYEQELPDEYKNKIASFINKSSVRYDQFKSYIVEWAKQEYDFVKEVNKVKLFNIYILFEPAEDEIFGLGYGVDFDEEHGCGVKAKIVDGEFKIFEIGTADVAFA